MPELVSKAKHTIWKYLGAMMMEEKDGHQAVSFTRTLGLCLFGMCACKWGFGGEVADSMLTTLWGLIGIKGAKDVAKAIKGG